MQVSKHVLYQKLNHNQLNDSLRYNSIRVHTASSYQFIIIPLTDDLGTINNCHRVIKDSCLRRSDPTSPCKANRFEMR